MKQLILASSSAARFMLLQRLTIPFEVAVPNIDERQRSDESAQQLVARLTKEKGLAVAAHYTNHLIISADQVIVVNNQAISKPESRQVAIEQLQSQSGQKVTALSGVGLYNSQTLHYQYACIETDVVFKILSLKQIESYLNKDETAYHCAGSLRVEALGISLLEEISSNDPTALIGLPLIALTNMLLAENLDVLDVNLQKN